MDVKGVLLQWFINCLIKKPSGDAVTRARSQTLPSQDKSALENKIISNQQLAEELQKRVVRKFEKRKSALIFYRQYLGC